MVDTDHGGRTVEANVLEEEEEKAASDPLLEENTPNTSNVDGSVLPKSPKAIRKDDAATKIQGEPEFEAQHFGDEGISPSRRGRGDTPIWCSTEEICNELTKLSYAPFDLFLVFYIKIAECIAYYAVAYVYTHYLTEDLGFSDRQAGSLYTLYGLLCTVIGFLMGVSIDRLGVRRSLLFGCVCSTLGRAMLCTSRSPFTCYISQLTLAPLAAAFGIPTLALAVRRYTHEANRSLAFSFFYACLCLACLLGSIMVNRIKSSHHAGVDVLGYHWSWMRLVMVWSMFCTATTVVAAYFLRDIQILSDQPLEDAAFEEARKNRVRTSLREVLEQRQFWRLAGVTLAFCGVRMMFRHMDATFPKYFMRTHGEHAPFEMILGIEPLLTMFLAPLATFALVKTEMRLDQTLLLGAFISGISGFVLAIEETYTSALGFVVILALGESIWSPKLYEFSTMAAPEGREGVYVAITFAPMYLSSVPVGVLSGWALSTFCGRNAAPEDRQGRLMWFLIALTSFSSFLILHFFRHRLFPPEDLEEANAADGSGEDSL